MGFKNRSKSDQRRLQPVRTDLQRIGGVRGPKSARALLDLSLREAGIEVAKRVPGRASAYSKPTVSGWEHGNAITEDVRQAYGILLANWLSTRHDQLIGITIAINSPWKVKAHKQCRRCRRWFHWRREKESRCERCRGEHS